MFTLTQSHSNPSLPPAGDIKTVKTFKAAMTALTKKSKTGFWACFGDTLSIRDDATGTIVYYLTENM